MKGKKLSFWFLLFIILSSIAYASIWDGLSRSGVRKLFSSGDDNITFDPSGGIFTLSNLILSQFTNDQNWTPKSIIINWINTNSTTDQAYTDTRVESVENLTIQEINDSIGNWSLDKSNYYTTTEVDNSFNALPNLTQTDVEGFFSSGDDNISYSSGVFTLTKLALGEFTNNLGWITNLWTTDVDAGGNNLDNLNRTGYDGSGTVWTHWNGSCLISHTPTTEIKQGSAC